MDIRTEILDTKQSIAKVAAKIEKLEIASSNASTSKQARIEAEIDKLQDEKIELQRQLAEYVKRLPLSK